MLPDRCLPVVAKMYKQALGIFCALALLYTAHLKSILPFQRQHARAPAGLLEQMDRPKEKNRCITAVTIASALAKNSRYPSLGLPACLTLVESSRIQQLIYMTSMSLQTLQPPSRQGCEHCTYRPNEETHSDGIGSICRMVLRRVTLFCQFGALARFQQRKHNP